VPVKRWSPDQRTPSQSKRKTYLESGQRNVAQMRAQRKEGKRAFFERCSTAIRVIETTYIVFV
jgi:hypothetical protein